MVRDGDVMIELCCTEIVQVDVRGKRYSNAVSTIFDRRRGWREPFHRENKDLLARRPATHDRYSIHFDELNLSTRHRRPRCCIAFHPRVNSPPKSKLCQPNRKKSGNKNGDWRWQKQQITTVCVCEIVNPWTSEKRWHRTSRRFPLPVQRFSWPAIHSNCSRTRGLCTLYAPIHAVLWVIRLRGIQTTHFNSSFSSWLATKASSCCCCCCCSAFHEKKLKNNQMTLRIAAIVY